MTLAESIYEHSDKMQSTTPPLMWWLRRIGEAVENNQTGMKFFVWMSNDVAQYLSKEGFKLKFEENGAVVSILWKVRA